MRDEEELTAEARRSQEETEKLREESGLGGETGEASPEPASPLPDAPRGEPWAKTSSGDAEKVVDDDS
ncbi:MAG: hypothetical protein JWM06_1238 [Actinomycetia bacterium]|jgi:hypothetical protein|nr:hypothetical protein [Actinomycetes bacterium]